MPALYLRIRALLASATLALPLASLALPLASCDDAVEPDLALDADLRVSGGQFFRGNMPVAEDGPPVKTVTVSPIVNAGSAGRSCSGVVDPAATAVALAIEGDRGYWVVPAGIPDVTAQGFPTFTADLAFSATLGAGRVHTLVRVVLPPLIPAVLTGFALAFARGVGEYGSIIFIAGNLPYVSEIAPLLIVIKLSEYDYGGACAIATIMLGISFLTLLAINLIQAWSRRRFGYV